jgi:uncharacterized protein YhhL (DUF1145 family)
MGHKINISTQISISYPESHRNRRLLLCLFELATQTSRDNYLTVFKRRQLGTEGTASDSQPAPFPLSSFPILFLSCPLKQQIFLFCRETETHAHSVSNMSRIPLFFRVFILYVDPFISLLAVYLCFFDPHAYIQNGVPGTLLSSTISNTIIPPLVEYIIMVVGSFSLCISAVQILLLHGFKDAPNNLNIKIWKIVMLGVLLADMGLVYSVYHADPTAFMKLGAWKSGDWINNGVLGALIAIRVSFLLGV